MASEKGKAFAEKILETSMLCVQTDAFYFDSCFDTNGKKEKTLTRTQFQLLMMLKALGRCSISQLAKISMTSKSSLSITLNRMAEDGYIRKKQDNKDKRIVYLQATAKGLKLLDKTLDQIVEEIDIFYHDIDEENQAILEAGIDCFYRILKSQVEEDNNEK